MNYLAHIYLSGGDDLLSIGNFAADSVHGNKYKQFPDRIQDGILLHRQIDTFTDAHPVFRASKDFVRPRFNHYSGILIDMFYDHFLASNWHEYHEQPLATYARDFYELLQSNYHLLPERTQRFLPYMIEYNWLVSYADIEGLKKILGQMSNRAKSPVNLALSTEELRANYSLLQSQFKKFFSELEAFVEEYRSAEL